MEQIFFLVLFMFFLISFFYIHKSYQDQKQIRKAVYINVLAIWLSFIFDFITGLSSTQVFAIADSLSLIKQGQFLLFLQASYLLLKFTK